MDTAKVFWSGRSQAVRLPKGFRLQSDEVRIRKHGNSIILEPIATDWKWLDDLPQKLDEDFVQFVCEKPPEEATRPELDELFE